MGMVNQGGRFNFVNTNDLISDGLIGQPFVNGGWT